MNCGYVEMEINEAGELYMSGPRASPVPLIPHYKGKIGKRMVELEV